MPEWMRVADVADCPPGSGVEVVVGDQIIAIFNVEGQLYALDGVCPHQGGPLARGTLTGCLVTCPWHGWQFDVRSGQHQLSPRLIQTPYNVRVEDGQILVSLDSPLA